jgi:hypothetical protein
MINMFITTKHVSCDASEGIKKKNKIVQNLGVSSKVTSVCDLMAV